LWKQTNSANRIRIFHRSFFDNFINFEGPLAYYGLEKGFFYFPWKNLCPAFCFLYCFFAFSPLEGTQAALVLAFFIAIIASVPVWLLSF